MTIELPKDQPFVVVRTQSEYGIHELVADLRGLLEIPLGGSSGQLQARCYFSSTFAQSYGHRVGYQTYAMAEHRELRLATRLLQKIEAKLAKMADTFGCAQDFAEFATRVIAASRYAAVYVQPEAVNYKGGAISSGFLKFNPRKDQDAMREAIRHLEQELLKRYGKKEVA